jgi:hypothetical protein
MDKGSFILRSFREKDLRRGFMEKHLSPSNRFGSRSWKTGFPTPFTHNRKPAFTKLKALSHKPHNAYYYEKSNPFLSV